jgi:hypothetical protein
METVWSLFLGCLPWIFLEPADSAGCLAIHFFAVCVRGPIKIRDIVAPLLLGGFPAVKGAVVFSLGWWTHSATELPGQPGLPGQFHGIFQHGNIVKKTKAFDALCLQPIAVLLFPLDCRGCSLGMG